MYLLDGARGEYFIMGQYLATRAGDGGPWRVSKVEHDATGRVMTLTLYGEWYTEGDARTAIEWQSARDEESRLARVYLANGA